MNRVILVGNLTADPEIRRLNDGSKVANLRMATNESWTDKATGEARSRVEFHRIVTFTGGLVEKVIEPFAKKGKQVLVEGQIRSRKWVDQAGVERISTEILIGPQGSFRLLGAAPRDSIDPVPAAAAAAPAAAAPDAGDDIPWK